MAPVDSKNLTIRRHSRTTIEYSITDRPLPKTVHGIILLFLGSIIRLVLGIWGLLIGFVVLNQQWQNWQRPGHSVSFIPEANDRNSSTSHITASHLLSLSLSLFTNPSPPPTSISPFWILTLSATLIFLSTYPRTTTESLLVLHTLGLQISHTITSFPILLSVSQTLKRVVGFDFGLSALFARRTVRFIPTTQIQDVLIHEAFVGWEVRYFLAVVIKGEGRTVVVFEALLPRLDVVQTVWRGVKDVLWADDGGKRRQMMGLDGDERIGEM